MNDEMPASISPAYFQPCDTGVDGWLVIDANGWRTVHLRKTQAEWFVKGLRPKALPADVIPLVRAPEPKCIQSTRMEIPPRIQASMADAIRSAMS